MRVFREPLFHFFLLGLAIFTWFSISNADAPASDSASAIVIDDKDVALLTEQFRATWRRPPTSKELSGLVQSMLREEVLVREAEALGLEQGDSVIRARLMQKMDFLTSSVAQAMTPDDATLIEHMKANPDRFTAPGRLSFEQIFLGVSPDQATVEEIRAALAAGAEPATLGTSNLLPPAVPLTQSRAIDATFGKGTYATMAALGDDGWQGPVQSGYGWHLVRVLDRVPATLPPFEQVRDVVLADWRREAFEKLDKAQFESLKAQYEVILPDLSATTDAAPQEVAQ